MTGSWELRVLPGPLGALCSSTQSHSSRRMLRRSNGHGGYASWIVQHTRIATSWIHALQTMARAHGRDSHTLQA